MFDRFLLDITGFKAKSKEIIDCFNSPDWANNNTPDKWQHYIPLAIKEQWDLDSLTDGEKQSFFIMASIRANQVSELPA